MSASCSDSVGGSVILHGELFYDQTEVDGSLSRKSNAVKTKLFLISKELPMPPLGAVASTCMYTVGFDIEGTNYQRDVSLSQAVKPGDVDRFTFEIQARKSSVHNFQFSLWYNRTESTAAEHIILELFSPRSNIRTNSSSTMITNSPPFGYSDR